LPAGGNRCRRSSFACFAVAALHLFSVELRHLRATIEWIDAFRVREEATQRRPAAGSLLKPSVQSVDTIALQVCASAADAWPANGTINVISAATTMARHTPLIMWTFILDLLAGKRPGLRGRRGGAHGQYGNRRNECDAFQTKVGGWRSRLDNRVANPE
jgi:hypothetical protein